jgi:hypothetical protein
MTALWALFVFNSHICALHTLIQSNPRQILENVPTSESVWGKERTARKILINSKFQLYKKWVRNFSDADSNNANIFYSGCWVRELMFSYFKPHFSFLIKKLSPIS